jgi:hypothetical protein
MLPPAFQTAARIRVKGILMLICSSVKTSKARYHFLHSQKVVEHGSICWEKQRHYQCDKAAKKRQQTNRELLAFRL